METAGHTLLLQGPLGPCFAGLAQALEARGGRVTQVVFNGGDQWFARGGRVLPYAGSAEAWPRALTALLQAERFDRVVLFGDCRPLHRVAIPICRRLGVPVWVVEEGYLRPVYLTVEREGVNGYSLLPRDPAAYLEEADEPVPPAPMRFPWMFARKAFTTMAWYCAHGWYRYRFPRYRHYRGTNIVREGLSWIRGGVLRLWRQRADRRAQAELADRRFALFPLQVVGDSQVIHHADVGGVQGSIARVLTSFAAAADRERLLVCKAHPMDRGYHDHAPLIRRLAAGLGIADRVRVVDTVPLPWLLDRAEGVVTVNSTVGLSALLHGVPTHALGRAIYDLPGLTHQGDLAAFWRAPTAPDPALLAAFRGYLLRRTQLNACSGFGVADWDGLARLGWDEDLLPTTRAVAEARDSAAETETPAAGRAAVAS